MSFWTNPVKAVASWVRPVDAFLKAVLPAPIYALVIMLLQDEAKAIGALAQARKDDVLSGNISIPDLAKEILKLGFKTALDDAMTIVRAYTTPTMGA